MAEVRNEVGGDGDGSPHARGHGRGTRGMDSCSGDDEARLFAGRTGRVGTGTTEGMGGRRIRNDLLA